MSKKENGVVLKKKSFILHNQMCNVTLEKKDGFFVVKFNGEISKKTANELFAVQYFNAL